MSKKYLCFTQDHDPEKAKLTFFQKYGCAPKETHVDHGILWVGPIPGSDLPAAGQVLDLVDRAGDELQMIMF